MYIYEIRTNGVEKRGHKRFYVRRTQLSNDNTTVRTLVLIKSRKDSGNLKLLLSVCANGKTPVKYPK